MLKCRIKLVVLFLLIHTVVGAGYGFCERQRGSEGVRDALKNRINEQSLELAFPNEKMPLLSRSMGKEEKVLAQQLEVIIGDKSTGHKVVPGDEIIVSFNDRDEVNTAIYKVNDNGDIYMHLVGKITVAGLRPYAIRKMLNDAMENFIREPNVSIQVNVTGKVMVLGAVGSPGLYPLADEMTVMEAILTAGSYDRQSAELRNVLVMRGTLDNPQVAKLDLHKMIKKGNRRDNISLKPGDMVYVPTNLITKFDDFIERVYRYVVIWYGLGGQDIVDDGDPFFGPINS